MIIDKFTFFSYITIKNQLLYPLNKFMSYSEVKKVSKSMLFRNSFFTIPFFLSADENELKEIKNKKLTLTYKKKNIGSITVKSISFFNKEETIKYLFSNKILKSKKHPFLDYIRKSKDYLIETEDFFLKKLKTSKKNQIGFATRNVPHKGHEKIIRYFCKKKKVLVHIFEDSSNNKKINSSTTIDAYQKFIKTNKLTKKVILRKIKFPSFLLGPRQAAIHALIAKNLNCDFFIVGRDHSGYKDYYNIFDLYNFCKKNEQKIGVKIFNSGSPIFCMKCKKILFRNECKCQKFIDISATFLRKTKSKILKRLLSSF